MVAMDVILGVIVLTIVISLILLRRYLPSRSKHSEEWQRLAETVKSAEVANDGFFRALEMVQKNLETLIARAESTEQRLRGLMLHPGIEKREQYTAAALLLGEGQDAERVAAMLSLPIAQVHLIRDLQQVGVKEKRNRQRRTEESVTTEKASTANSATPREKAAARPILLVDAIKTAASV